MAYSAPLVSLEDFNLGLVRMVILGRFNLLLSWLDGKNECSPHMCLCFLMSYNWFFQKDPKYRLLRARPLKEEGEGGGFEGYSISIPATRGCPL